MRVPNLRLVTNARRMLSKRLEIGFQIIAALMVALLLNCTLLLPVAQAAVLDWNSVNWTSGTGAPPITQTFGPLGDSGVSVRLTFTGDDIINDPTGITDPPTAPSTAVTGGATPASTLLLLINGATNADSITARFEYLDSAGNTIPAENSQFVIIDVDTSSTASATTPGTQTWNDQVTVGGSSAPTLTPTTSAFADIVPTIFPLATPAFYTPSIIGNIARGVMLGGIGDDGDEWRANNTGSNGSIVVSYASAITEATFEYGYGPLAQADPVTQGIGLYNNFFDPVAIGVSKQASNVVSNTDGTYTITYRLVVENMGGVELRNVQITEDLSGTFAAPATFTVTGTRLIGTTRAGTPAPNINAGFNGTTNTNLLDGTGSLLARELDANNTQTAPGGTATIEFDVQVTPNGNFGPFNNTAQASGTSPGGRTVTDDSVDGADPDPNNDGSATDNTSPTVVTLTPTNESLQLVKRITAVFRGGAELVRYNTFNDQPGTTTDNDLNAATTGAAVNEPVGVFQLPANVGLQTGDQLEYSLYYWNPSAVTNITGISLCDEVQAPATLDTTSLQRSNPIVNATSTALTYAASATVASRVAGAALDAYCPSAPGTFPTGGGVVVQGPFDINAAAPNGQYGAIRFRVTVP